MSIGHKGNSIGHKGSSIGHKGNYILQVYVVRSERGISIDADSGPPRYIL